MHIDFLGPLTQTLHGNSYVGLAVCALTKYVEAAGKIANTKLTFLNIRIPLRFKPTTTPLGTPFWHIFGALEKSIERTRSERAQNFSIQ